MTDQSNSSKLKSALNFGALLGLILMIIQLITYLFELYEATWLSFLSIIILAAGISVGIKKFRDNERNGIISYGNALGYGVLVAIFSGVITSFVAFLYLKFIDGGLIDFTLEKQEEALYNAGIPDDQIEMQMGYVKKFTSAGMMAFWGLVANTFIGFIVSLIASAFLKKEAEHFDDVQ